MRCQPTEPATASLYLRSRGTTGDFTGKPSTSAQYHHNCETFELPSVAYAALRRRWQQLQQGRGCTKASDFDAFEQEREVLQFSPIIWDHHCQPQQQQSNERRRKNLGPSNSSSLNSAWPFDVFPAVVAVEWQEDNECSLDAEGIETTSSPLGFIPVSSGCHYFSLILVDARAAWSPAHVNEVRRQLALHRSSKPPVTDNDALGAGATHQEQVTSDHTYVPVVVAVHHAGNQDSVDSLAELSSLIADELVANSRGVANSSQHQDPCVATRDDAGAAPGDAGSCRNVRNRFFWELPVFAGVASDTDEAVGVFLQFVISSFVIESRAIAAMVV